MTLTALQVRDVYKAFGATQALDGAALRVEKGEVHALVGGNGSGKSTLMKVLAGVAVADRGEVEIGGEWRDLRSFSPDVARRNGLHFVHQQPTTFGDLTVAENLALGHGFETARSGRIRWRATRRRAAEVLTRFGLEIDPSQRVAELSPASQTMIEIARALQDQDDQDEGLVALDEPTAALAPREVERLLEILRNLAALGQSILFVSHRLDEVLGVADRITVLRDGKYIDTVSPEGLTRERLTELITGREMASYRPEAVSTGTHPDALIVEGLHGGSILEANLSVAHGEIVGVAGLAGSGRSTLLRLLFGVQPRDGGVVRLDGGPLAPRTPGDAIRARVAYVSENRVQDAILPGLSVAENMSILDPRKYWRRGWIRRDLERADVDESIRRFHIRAASANAPITSLSGGNQQKVALGRWLRLEPRLLLLDEPTQGVDVGARAELWALIRKVAEGGTPVIVVSSDFEELTQLCSRLVVLRSGVTVANISAADLDPDEINQLLHEMQVAA